MARLILGDTDYYSTVDYRTCLHIIKLIENAYLYAVYSMRDVRRSELGLFFLNEVPAHGTSAGKEKKLLVSFSCRRYLVLVF